MCKGVKHACGLSYCPILSAMHVRKDISKRRIESVFGPSNTIFVGSYNYPNISVGPLVSEDMPLNPKSLYNLDYNDVIQYLSRQIRGKRYTTATSQLDEKIKEVSLSIKPVDVEVVFSRPVDFRLKFSYINMPVIAGAPMRYFDEAENPRIPKIVDSLIDSKMHAYDSVLALYKQGYDTYYITSVLSSGVLGRSPKIVPTRWSITAVDDMVAKGIAEEVRGYPEINDFLVFTAEKFNNHFEIIMLPGKWQFENFEAWAPKTVWAMFSSSVLITEEYEGFTGRTKYAEKQAGGYYAVRLAVLEYLRRKRKQASVVCIREISEGYMYPLGVWEVRENVRHALSLRPKKFNTLKDALSDVSSRIMIDISEYTKRSRIIGQSTLPAWIL